MDILTAGLTLTGAVQRKHFPTFPVKNIDTVPADEFRRNKAMIFIPEICFDKASQSICSPLHENGTNPALIQIHTEPFQIDIAALIRKGNNIPTTISDFPVQGGRNLICRINQNRATAAVHYMIVYR